MAKNSEVFVVKLNPKGKLLTKPIVEFFSRFKVQKAVFYMWIEDLQTDIAEKYSRRDQRFLWMFPRDKSNQGVV